MTTRLALLPVVALVLACAACASPATGAGATGTGTAAASPSASSPAVAPSPTAAAVVFDGDCAQVLTDAQRGAILGSGSQTQEEAFAAAYPDVVNHVAPDPAELLGGVQCGWVAADDADLPEGLGGISVMILPAASVAAEYSEALADARCDPSYDSTFCRLARSEGDTWVMASARSELTEPPAAVLEATLDAVAANLASTSPPVAAPRMAEWWAFPACDALGEELQLSDLLGDRYHSGHWEGSDQFEDLILRGAGVRQYCQYSSNSEALPDGHDFSILSVELLPGGGAQWTDAAADETAPTVAGAESAFQSHTGGEWPVWRLRARDGVNLLNVTAEGDDIDVEVAERVLAAFGD